MKIGTLLKYLLFAGLAIGLLVYVFRLGNLSLAEFWHTVAAADLGWVALSAGLLAVANWARARRWQLLLAPLGFRPPIRHAMLAVWLGYFANYLVPRLGEVSRCTALWQTDQIPAEQSLGTVVTERVFDVLCLFLLLGLHLLLDFERLMGFIRQAGTPPVNNMPPAATGYTWLLPLLAAGAVLGLLVFFVFRKKILSGPLARKVLATARGLLAGVLSIRHMQQPGLFLVCTCLIWGMYFASAYVLFFALPQYAHLRPMAGLTCLVAGALAMVLPTPGGTGAFHVVVAAALTAMYGLAAGPAAVLATFIHGTQMVLTLLAGLPVGLAIFLIRNRQKALLHDRK